MRVTQSMLSNNMLRNLSNSYGNMSKYQDQLTTGKKITRPSDDPVVAMKGVMYRTNLQEVEQYKRNFSEAHNWVENSDAALDQATSAVQRIRELTVQASNDTYDAGQRKSIATEIEQLKEHIQEIANTRVGDKYIFNGTNTLVKPVDLSQVPPQTSNNSNPVKIELSKGVYLTVNVDASNVFSNSATIGDGNGLFSDIQGLINDLNNPANSGGDINKYLTLIDDHVTSLLSTRAQLGARSNRLELMEARVGEQEVIANKLMSENEDADIERVITNLKTQEAVQNAALSVGARIIQPSLVDFLR
jgi:flagellar hook-associated protein 3 FlgL